MSDDLTDRPNAEEVIARELRRSGLSTALADADAPDYVSALMREGYGIWDIAALDAHTAGLVGDARQARSLLAEARDEITRLREGVERHRSSWQRPEIVGGDSLDVMDPHGFDRALWALLDAGDALNVGPDTTGEGT